MVGWDIVGQCRAGGEGAWPPRAERGVKGQHAPALHCIYNPRHEYYPTTLLPYLPPALLVLYYGPACPDPFVPASWQCLYHGPHTPPISILWTGRARHQRRCSWPTIYPRLSGRACLQTPHLRDHSLPWFLSDHPDACCLIFLSRKFIFSWQLYYEVSVFTDLQLFFFILEAFLPLYIKHDIMTQIYISQFTRYKLWFIYIKFTFAFADPGPEGSLSSLVLVRPPRCLLLDFFCPWRVYI